MRLIAGAWLLLGAILLVPAGTRESRSQDDFAAMTPAELKSNIEASHPAAYYVLASKLFSGGTRDEAVVWFYAGQLRYRFHLAAHPDLPADGDRALLASLSEVVGRPINEYAAGNVEEWASAMQGALDWDEQHDNGFTSKSAYAEQWLQQRAGLAKLRANVRAQAAEIRQQRLENGLENR
ncbi:hypothetical protein M8997_011080 [Phyllobacterium sp. 21LDTY02-6]|uniref:hypothetical protein n=1 Tax=Phyllobacterium sp. 21LDTY02-6 TaxID=2944903 RepID=UPI002022013D|nr:hypothetical protein [Phyllobacterium sp. 21LDTY02-6]MCO4317727.1 hypothetical protein [Phyllobacterium sp. 21LDTY02-6]